MPGMLKVNLVSPLAVLVTLTPFVPRDAPIPDLLRFSLRLLVKFIDFLKLNPMNILQ